MGEKSERKKQYIIEKARGVFARKGYKAVTMKDIVEACEISRGGLYLYFGSTREIFEAVMAAENADEDDEDVALTKAINVNASASDMLAIFIKAQKKEVFRKRNNLTVASYEYFTEITGGGPGQGDLKGRFDTAVMIIERLVISGTDSGEFACDDPEGWARNLMYVIEGMKVLAHTMGVTEAMFDREMLYVLRNLIAPDMEHYAEPEEASHPEPYEDEGVTETDADSARPDGEDAFAQEENKAQDA